MSVDYVGFDPWLQQQEHQEYHNEHFEDDNDDDDGLRQKGYAYHNRNQNHGIDDDDRYSHHYEDDDHFLSSFQNSRNGTQDDPSPFSFSDNRNSLEDSGNPPLQTPYPPSYYFENTNGSIHSDYSQNGSTENPSGFPINTLLFPVLTISLVMLLGVILLLRICFTNPNCLADPFCRIRRRRRIENQQEEERILAHLALAMELVATIRNGRSELTKEHRMTVYSKAFEHNNNQVVLKENMFLEDSKNNSNDDDNNTGSSTVAAVAAACDDDIENQQTSANDDNESVVSGGDGDGDDMETQPISLLYANDLNDSESITRCLYHPRNIDNATDKLVVGGTCVICFEEFEEGDTIVWSETDSCPHVYHKDCMVSFLAHNTKVSGRENPCPTCRQPFLNLSNAMRTMGTTVNDNGSNTTSTSSNSSTSSESAPSSDSSTSSETPEEES